MKLMNLDAEDRLVAVAKLAEQEEGDEPGADDSPLVEEPDETVN